MSVKVENILKGSIYLIPSPSVIFKLLAGKFAWGVRQIIAGCCQQSFALLPQGNFPGNNLNVH